MNNPALFLGGLLIGALIGPPWYLWLERNRRSECKCDVTEDLIESYQLGYAIGTEVLDDLEGLELSHPKHIELTHCGSRYSDTYQITEAGADHIREELFNT